MCKNAYKYCSLLLFLIACYSCRPSSPNQVNTGQDELQALEIDHQIDVKGLELNDLIYVPIYSDLYADLQNQNLLLSATLSIRNTDLVNPLFINKLDYYDTHGKLVKDYLNGETISIPPMATINYVIEKEDTSGGSGANFIVSIHAKNKNMKPIIQAVMVHHSGNKGFAFTTDGYSVL